MFDNRLNVEKEKREKQVQDLLNLVEQVSKKNNGKSYMGDLSLKLKVKKDSSFVQFHISFLESG